MKLAIIGYGKMGQTIEQIANARNHDILHLFTKEKLISEHRDALKEVDVAIEFSYPQAAVQNISTCIEEGIPIVSGTTGWLDHYKDILSLCAKHNGTFLYASNFSIGVNLFFALNKKLAQLMAVQEEYDVNMTEIHHIHKLDAPSGTAISLAEDIIAEHKLKNKWIQKNTGDEEGLLIQSERTGEIPGTHIIDYTSKIDKISISHEAYSRQGFAQGAVVAAEYISDKTGVFTMKDVLNIE